MGATRSSQRLPCGLSASRSPLIDPLALKVRHLSQYGNDDLSHTPGNLANAVDVQRYPTGNESPHDLLDVQGIAPEAVERVDADHVALAGKGQQLGKTGALFSRYSAANAFVGELVVRCPEALALGLNGLVLGRYSVVVDC